MSAPALAAPRVFELPLPDRRGSLAWLRERGMGASILVAAIASAFGVVLVQATAYIAALLRANPFVGASEVLAVIIGILSLLLTGVAMYVAGIVTANTFSTIIAGRTRRIALLRLIGASARSQRAEVTNQGFVVGVIGAVLGVLLGFGIAAAGIAVASRLLAGAPEDFSLWRAAILLPAAGVALVTWAAAAAGSRRVLAVTPLQAIGGSVDRSREEVTARPVRHAGAFILFILGVVLLILGVLLGLVTPLGVVVGFFGGILSFTGLAIGATLVMPPLLRLVGRLFGGGATARLAAQNALRYPERSSRMAIGVVMGVTLVTMFAVALESSKQLMFVASGGSYDPAFVVIIDSFSAVMMMLVGICAVIAAVGLVNLLTIGVVQRRRELGLLRAVGLSSRQVRRMVLLEALHVTVTATVTGLVLGIAYGWIAAQSLLGSIAIYDHVGPAGLVAPHVPWLPMTVVVVAAGILTVVAAVAPTRLATRVVPVEALAAE